MVGGGFSTLMGNRLNGFIGQLLGITRQSSAERWFGTPMKLSELEKLLREASEAYYAGDPSFLSDAEFDRFRDELEELDPKNSFLAEVGAPSDSALQKVSHSIPMGSLKKITALAEFVTWRNTVSKTAKSLECAVQLKLDGLSIEMLYEKGKFVQAITRGDGEVGDDVTHTIKNAQGFPKTISETSRVSVRCEAMLKIADWKNHFSDKANPRNAAAGLVRRTDAKGSKHLSTFAFDVLFDNSGFETEADRIKWLKDEGFQTTPNKVVKADDVEKIIDGINDRRERMPIEIDGAVIKLNLIADQEKLGQHHGRPYWARAWKFAAMGAHTVLKGVEWTVGTQGTITPVAKVKPVSVGGTTISNVTLHNMDEIVRLGIAIGDEIEVIRAGDVIPKIVRVVSEGKNRQTIKIKGCPSCGSPIGRDGPRVICTNTNCSGTQYKKIQKWVKKRDIMFLGDSNLELLWNAKIVQSVACLYELTMDSMVKAGLGKRMSEKILEQIEKSRNCSLADLIGSLSLDMLGRSEAGNLIAQGVDTLGKWKCLSASHIAAMPGFQKTKATRISSAVRDNLKLIEAVAAKLTVTGSFPMAKDGKLSQKSFVICLTGSMSRSRKEIAADIEAAGHRVSDRVSKELTHLCQADPNSKSSKTKKAENLGIPVISESQLVAML